MHVSCHAHAAAFAIINFKIDEVVYGYDRKVYQFPIKAQHYYFVGEVYINTVLEYSTWEYSSNNNEKHSLY